MFDPAFGGGVAVVGPDTDQGEEVRSRLVYGYHDRVEHAELKLKLRMQHIVNSGGRIVDWNLTIDPTASPKVRSWIAYEETTRYD